jgi:uncharacterized protein YyaL (SSP411 family)
MPNRLENETSPYLRQHANNPVDWYPWGPDALSRARTEGKPILVSIGYSACHWCHVMAHESFEDERTAALMNENFVNIKVDREERPDVDSIYMEAVQALTGSGGWPLNVFLTPDARPFFGGTYFPPQPRHGLPSWTQVVEGVAETFAERADDVVHNAQVLTRVIEQAQRQGVSEEPLTTGVLEEAYAAVVEQFEMRLGGFGNAPKFPQPLGLEFVLRMYSRTHDPKAVEFLNVTLGRMADGGMYDQLGGGFHRYSVDDIWLVPHFEKMLYDNALLARIYIAAFVATGEVRYRQVAEETLDYLLRDLRSPDGAFYSAQDADSEGVEGKFYVWSFEELVTLLGEDDARLAADLYRITPEGNFEGVNILTRASTIEDVAQRVGQPVDEVTARLERARSTLLKARESRVPPNTDTKILAGWNALAIRSLAEAGRVLDRPDYLEAAQRAMRFLLKALRPDGRLVRNYHDGPGTIGAFLEDYSFILEALIALYMTVFDRECLHEARALVQEMIDLFWDDEDGAFFDTAGESNDLVVRPRGLFDNPIPSGNSAAAFALLRLEALTGSTEYGDRAATVFRAARKLLTRAPLGVSYMLSALDFHLSSPIQIAIAGPVDSSATQAFVRAVYERYLPNAVVAIGHPGSAPLLENRELRDGQPTAYVCERFVCRLPVTTVHELGSQLDALTRGTSSIA